jgi:hypothetical protein
MRNTLIVPVSCVPSLFATLAPPVEDEGGVLICARSARRSIPMRFCPWWGQDGRTRDLDTFEDIVHGHDQIGEA